MQIGSHDNLLVFTMQKPKSKSNTFIVAKIINQYIFSVIKILIIINNQVINIMASIMRAAEIMASLFVSSTARK